MERSERTPAPIDEDVPFTLTTAPEPHASHREVSDVRAQYEWSEQSPFRPFCSERCRVIDLGAWLTEKHAIPDSGTQLAPDAPEEPAD